MSSSAHQTRKSVPSALASLACYCLIRAETGHFSTNAGLLIFGHAIDWKNILGEVKFSGIIQVFSAWGALLLIPVLILLRHRTAFIVVSSAAMFCLWVSWIGLLVLAEAKEVMVATSIPFFIAQIFWALGFTRYVDNKS
jgi:hypothetical protein